MTSKFLVLAFWNVVLFFLQISFVPLLTIWHVRPDLSLVATFLSGWVLGPIPGVFTGVLQGPLLDWFNGYLMGLHLFWYALCGLLSGILQRPVLEENRLPTFLLTCLFTAITHLGMLGLMVGMAFDLSWRDALLRLAILVPYNGLITTVIYLKTTKFWRWWRRGLPRG